MRLLVFSVLLAASAAAAAAPAPLPPHWTGEHSEEGESDYRAPPRLRGIYGHGFLTPLNLRDSADDPPPCRGDEAAVAAYVAQAGDYGEEYWFYATAAQGVLFVRSVRVNVEQPCAQGVLYGYEIHRAYVADGMVHVMEVDDDDAELLGSRPIASNDREYSGGFAPLHNMMARAAPPPRGRRRNARVAGLRAQCWVQGGLVWSSICFSRVRGPTYNMILSTAAGDDERQHFGSFFDLVRPDAELDGRLFELDRRWRRR